MSVDYFVYLKHAEGFSAQAFEAYCGSLGLRIQLHPGFKLLEDEGFLPIRFADDRFHGDGGERAYLSGFELYASEYHHVLQPPKKETGFFRFLRKTRAARETPFDKAVKEAAWLLELGCGSADSFEVLLAYVFGAYLVKCCGGVFDDPQTGQFYETYSWMETEVAAIIGELREQATAQALITHEFTGWT